MSPRIRLNLDEIPDFIPVDPGRHKAKLTGCEKEVSSAGNDMLVWDWEIKGGDSNGRTIRSYTSLLEDALSGLKMHLKALGYGEGEVDVDTKKLIGKMAVLVVTARKYRDRETGEEKIGSSVSSVLPDTGKALKAGSGKAEPEAEDSKPAGKKKKASVVDDDNSDIPF